jgi:hypothetical protein
MIIFNLFLPFSYFFSDYINAIVSFAILGVIVFMFIYIIIR